MYEHKGIELQRTLFFDIQNVYCDLLIIFGNTNMKVATKLNVSECGYCQYNSLFNKHIIPFD